MQMCALYVLDTSLSTGCFISEEVKGGARKLLFKVADFAG